MHTPPSFSQGSVAESSRIHTVVFADDAVLLRQSMAIAFPMICPSCSVVGQASDGDEAVELCMRLGPSVLITDLRMPKRNGIGLITHFRPVLPSMRVIIHTGCESADLLGLACDAHPAGVIHGEDGVIGLRRAFEAAIAGERYVSKAVMDRIDRQGGKRNTLTPTEISVLSMVLEEQKSSEIARRLGMSERTVGAHRESIHKKLGTHSQAALLKWAMRNGLME